MSRRWNLISEKSSYADVWETRRNNQLIFCEWNPFWPYQEKHLLSLPVLFSSFFSLYIFCITYVSASPNPADAMSSLKFINDNQNCVGCEEKEWINLYTYKTWYKLGEQAKKPFSRRLVWLWPINCTFSFVSKFGCFLVMYIGLPLSQGSPHSTIFTKC